MSERTATVVVGSRVVEFEFARLDDRTVDVVVREQGRKWNFREPGWVGLSYGSAGGCVYWWSARRLVIMPADPLGQVQSVEVDEDIRFVFRLPQRWLLICETSARLRTVASETGRLDFSDVVTGAGWEGDTLVVSVWKADAVTVVVEGDRMHFRRADPDDGSGRRGAKAMKWNFRRRCRRAW